MNIPEVFGNDFKHIAKFEQFEILASFKGPKNLKFKRHEHFKNYIRNYCKRGYLSSFKNLFILFIFLRGAGGGYFLVNFDVLEASNSKLFIKTEIFLKLAVKIHSYYIHFD